LGEKVGSFPEELSGTTGAGQFWGRKNAGGCSKKIRADDPGTSADRKKLLLHTDLQVNGIKEGNDGPKTSFNCPIGRVPVCAVENAKGPQDSPKRIRKSYSFTDSPDLGGKTKKCREI